MSPSWSHKLSGALCLSYEGQDWGIVNADPDRIEEFVAFCEANAVDHPWEPEALAELVFASADLAAGERDLADAERWVILRFVADHGNEFPDMLGYWRSLPASEFPVAVLVREGSS